MKKINTKSIARIAAVQLLYQYNDDLTVEVEILHQRIIDYYRNGNVNVDYEDDGQYKIKLPISYFINLTNYAVKQSKSIDRIISNNLNNQFNIKDLESLILSILRVAIAEFKLYPQTPYKIVINEFTTIANEMINLNEVNFINSILDKIGKDLFHD